ncbi:uncharacterized protein B0H18DRAFT_1041708 [Fomitopsis serialis]|uniref:uncharacterized protein n=1 Tax=Fomitopsis serialis TaxID=139415 RepID=UPI00200863FF|nr:uncharacterized protein B0H18DRAFT_1041708 [Neoantrodia serialis]KAH9915399.1 hypothetical protein B0H18DRAFT_1041708 [Neoantrodia serialis]
MRARELRLALPPPTLVQRPPSLVLLILPHWRFSARPSDQLRRAYRSTDTLEYYDTRGCMRPCVCLWHWRWAAEAHRDQPAALRRAPSHEARPLPRMHGGLGARCVGGEHDTTRERRAR